MYLNSLEKEKIKKIKIRIYKINKRRKFTYNLEFNITRDFEKICLDNKLHYIVLKKWENERVKIFSKES